jgi:predicted GNAT superfamily acetyltransferase
MSAMHHHPHTEVAQVEADTAATRASVVIGEVSRPDELDELRDTLRHIWGPEVVPPRNLLRGMALGGACLLVAREDGRPVGFALGFLGWVEGVHLHSHQVGVIPELRAAGVGYALKLAQRAQALRHGVAEMRWTYDPMLYANARFNLVRLGAEMVAFHPHCYGDRHDTFNSGDRTDRVEVSWQLDRDVIGGAATLAAPEDLQLELPLDFHALRRDDPEGAADLRRRVGSALADAIAAGRSVRMGERGYVVLGGAA